MALLFGLGSTDKKPKKPKNKQQSYVKDEPQTKMGVAKKPAGTKQGTATKNPSYKNETSCTSGKATGNSCAPPVKYKVTGLPPKKGEPKENPPTEIAENKDKPEKTGSYKNTLLLGNQR